jgi:hypothetical protein
MIASPSRQHPLFDPTSLYNKMRTAPHFTLDKMRGYWDWLCFEHERAEKPLPPTEPRSEKELHDLTSRLQAQHGTRCIVLDALRVHAWFIGEGEHEGSLRAVPEVAEALLVREEDGSRTIGLLLEGQPRRWFPGATQCRAFFLEPVIAKRLASALRAGEEGFFADFLPRALQPEPLRENYAVASLLAGLPELEGEMPSDRELEVWFSRLAIHGGEDRFPPRAGPLHIAVFSH